MERLRSLSESDCYARLYGQREPTVTIVSREPRVKGPTTTGAELRDAFDQRLSQREQLDRVDAEAA